MWLCWLILLRQHKLFLQLCYGQEILSKWQIHTCKYWLGPQFQGKSSLCLKYFLQNSRGLLDFRKHCFVMWLACWTESGVCAQKNRENKDHWGRSRSLKCAKEVRCSLQSYPHTDTGPSDHISVLPELNTLQAGSFRYYAWGEFNTLFPYWVYLALHGILV